MGKNSGMNGKDLFIGAVVGGALGAAAALLLAPQTGRETRRDIAKGLETARENFKEQGDQVSLKAAKVKEAAADRWIDIRESTTGTAKEVASTMEGVGKKLEEIGEKVAKFKS
ncbi:YtxH-like protein [Marininema mesophilum]|uniref:YtxH-like protein n=1 Tax=Marininema mesophilum TaxID=1048340 RepID=A0A1H3BZQ1_9BACL|nr:YtxH domain-containing protein [Marininema mesophilum]SDX47377.1 YtxH-like protein [Marininema mesophilum]